MELDILPFRNCILWRPDQFDANADDPGRPGTYLRFLPKANINKVLDIAAPSPSPLLTATPATPIAPAPPIEAFTILALNTPCQDLMETS